MLERFFTRRKLEKVGLKYINVTNSAIEKYRDFVKDNKEENLSDMLIKINRNYQCSNVTREFKHHIEKCYGNLVIKYSKDDDIIYDIYNNRGKTIGLYIDKSIKDKYDAVLNKDKVGVLCVE